jgi:hypothetical protein
MHKVGAMRIPSAVAMIVIAVMATSVAHGQVPSGKTLAGPRGPGAKPSGPSAGTGDRALIPPALPAIPPPGDALRNLAGGGYANDNYVPPGQRSKSVRNRVIHTSRARFTRRYARYCYPTYLCGYCYYD